MQFVEWLSHRSLLYARRAWLLKGIKINFKGTCNFQKEVQRQFDITRENRDQQLSRIT